MHLRRQRRHLQNTVRSLNPRRYPRNPETLLWLCYRQKGSVRRTWVRFAAPPVLFETVEVECGPEEEQDLPFVSLIIHRE